ncbi:CUB and peptidase domain-containing protein 2-like [Lingula anatina]|uniref:CUB and peptidase domain-containing protein 2-like n=1 Tax=Lingula anatina TaxID=7574 RepID=A0A1S3HWC6_LINAN|nr:CUB and peptidase domain-containing protein 2-like [Lingula anatina]|eukprot:XP_013390347.1 CUB and peptidase domain-containing protein 2-like [Lingula anatina]
MALKMNIECFRLVAAIVILFYSDRPLCRCNGLSTVQSIGNQMLGSMNYASRRAREVVDLIFLVDESNSVSEEDFKSELEFIRNILEHFSVAPQYTQVGIITFGTDARVHISLNEMSDKCEFITRLGQVRNRGGMSNIYQALYLAKQDLDRARYTGRGALQVVFLLNDGHWNIGGDPKLLVDHMKKGNVEFVAVGMGRWQKSNLNDLSSSDKNGKKLVYDIKTFKQFRDIARYFHKGQQKFEYQPAPATRCGSKCRTGAYCSCDARGGQEYICVCNNGYHIKREGQVMTCAIITTARPTSIQSGCGGNRDLTGTTGVIKSLNYGTGNYNNNANCKWKITAPAGKIIKLTFLAFAVEEGGTSCRFDKLSVYDGSSTSARFIKNYCGKGTPNEISTTGNALYLTFTSDRSEVESGFSIRYTVVDPPRSCGTPAIDAKLGNNRIVGGTEAISGSWPWQVSVRYRGSHICGGSLISDQWVATAAHCLEERNLSPRYWSISAGKHRKYNDPDEEIVQVQTLIRHENYDHSIWDNDITLFKLAKPVTLSDRVHPVCLPTTVAADNTFCYVSGWGIVLGTGNSGVLKQALVPIVKRQTCNSWYRDISVVTGNMICAGYEAGGHDACQGDSGGPLVCKSGGKFELHGITSWGDGCAGRRKPGVYTKVVNYLDWIQQKMTQYGA